MSINIHSSDDEIRNFLLSPDDNTPTEPQPQQNTGNEQTAPASQPMKQQTTNEGTSQQEGNPPYVRRYSHHSCAELCRQKKPIPYLIKGYIRKGGLGMIYGESGCGKSFTVIDMAASIACNNINTWHGTNINHGPVIYFAGEGADGLNARLACWCNEHNIDPENVQLEIIDEIFKLDCGKDDPAHSIENTIAEIKATFPNPALVVFDTLNVYMQADENNNTDAGNFCALCRRIIQECACTVLIVHHTGLNPDAKKRGRGASAFKGAMDFVLQLIKESDNLIKLSTPKIKDGKEQPELPFNLRQHEIPDWFDENGEPVTSCTIELAEKLIQYREAIQEEKKKPKLKPAQKTAFDTFREAAKIHGEIIINNPETGHETVRVEDTCWRDYFYEHLPRKNEDPKKEKERKRVAFYNAKQFMTVESQKLTIQREEGREYYCLDLSGNTDAAYRLEIRTAIKNREEADTSRGAKHTSEGETTNETTGYIF